LYESVAICCSLLGCSIATRLLCLLAFFECKQERQFVIHIGNKSTKLTRAAAIIFFNLKNIFLD